MVFSKDETRLLGLDRREQKVLSVLNEKGMSISELVIKSRLPRMTLYSIIFRLQKRDLVTSVKNGARALYVCTDSKILFNKFDSLSDKFSLTRETKNKEIKFTNSTKSDFVLYKGAQNLRNLYKRIVKESAGDRFYFIEPNKTSVSSHEKMTYKDLLEINHSLRKGKTIADGIMQDNWLTYNVNLWNKKGKDARLLLDAFADRMYNVYTVPKELLDFASELYVFKNVALLINWNDEIAIEIRSEEMVAFLKQIIELLKGLAQKIDVASEVKKEIAKLNP